MTQLNVDPAEIDKFTAAAADWWNPNGAMGALHDINPLRLAFIASRVAVAGRRILDVGCGAGLISEGLAKAGARVTGIDMNPAALAAAKAHGAHLAIDYRHASIEDLAEKTPEAFDVVVCMELLEHVPSPESIISASARLLRPGGSLFLATVNRTLLAYLLVIVAAERLLRIVTPGTHLYRRLVRPNQIRRWAATSGLRVESLKGMRYIPIFRRCWLTRDTSTNYLMHLVRTRLPRRPGEER